MQSEHEGLKFMIDYLTVSSKVHDVGKMIVLLGMEESSWVYFPSGRWGYHESWVCDHITILFGAKNPEMGICLDMSGQGCRRFETEGHGDYNLIFQALRNNEGFMNITRIDIACDDFSDYLPMQEIVRKVRAMEYVSKAKKWKIIDSDDGVSVYHGSPRSDFLINIYDKALERGFDDGLHWVRCEMRINDDRARSAAMKLLDGHSVGELYSGVLLNYLRYVDVTHSRIENCTTSEWWTRFIGDAEKISLYEKPGVEYNMSKLDRYVFEMAGGAIETAIEHYGLIGFERKLKDTLHAKEYERKEKYKKILEDYGTHEQRLQRYRSGGNALSAGAED